MNGISLMSETRRLIKVCSVSPTRSGTFNLACHNNTFCWMKYCPWEICDNDDLANLRPFSTNVIINACINKVEFLKNTATVRDFLNIQYILTKQ